MKKSFKTNIIIPSNYTQIFSEIKNVVKIARYKAINNVNRELIKMYIDLGKIVNKQTQNGRGESIIEKLSKDLQMEFPGVKGFSTRNLRRIKMVYNELQSQTKILPQLVAEIPWGHIVVLFEKVKKEEERVYYIKKTIDLSRSRSTLEENIEFNLFKKNSIQNNFNKSLGIEKKAEISLEFVDQYNFSFLGLEQEHTERVLENSLVEHITKTLGIFGQDFAFMGRQFRLEVIDKEYFVDLLFYHRKLKCLIAIELKTVEFKPEHSQKLNWYIHLLDKQVRYPGDNPTIGILICRSKDRLLVEYALELANNPIGVATYTYNNLPKEISQYLPDENMIKKYCDMMF